MKVFKEEQRFTQLWLIIFLAVSIIVPIAIVTQEYLKEKPSLSFNEFILTLLLIIASAGFIFFFKLKTRIDETGIHYQFFPFHFFFKTIIWNDINSAVVRKYDAISEYGGWGLKGGVFWKKSKGTAINVSGNIGIQLILKNNKKLLIGTKKEIEAKRILETYQHKIV